MSPFLQQLLLSGAFSFLGRIHARDDDEESVQPVRQYAEAVSEVNQAEQQFISDLERTRKERSELYLRKRNNPNIQLPSLPSYQERSLAQLQNSHLQLRRTQDVMVGSYQNQQSISQSSQIGAGSHYSRTGRMGTGGRR